MTFNATDPCYAVCKRAGYDWAPTPFREFRVRERGLFVAERTAKILSGQTLDQGFAPVATNALVSKFVEGRAISVSRQEEPEAELKLMIGVEELWTLCVRMPRPGWRLVGRFIARDCFVILHPVHRDALAPAMAEAIFQTAIDIWNADFRGNHFVQSPHLSDYLAGQQYNDLDA